MQLEQQWRHRSDADDLADGEDVLGLLKDGTRILVCVTRGHWCYSAGGMKCTVLSMWHPLPRNPDGWEPLNHPECSICRRRHGSEIVHACEWTFRQFL